MKLTEVIKNYFHERIELPKTLKKEKEDAKKYGINIVSHTIIRSKRWFPRKYVKKAIPTINLGKIQKPIEECRYYNNGNCRYYGQSCAGKSCTVYVT